MTSATAGRDSPDRDGRARIDARADALRAAAEAARGLRERYRASGQVADKRLGQHFLADLNLARKIVDLLPPPRSGPVVEIGPGLGALTFLLAGLGYRVVAFELDGRLAEALTEAIAPWPRIEIRRGDIREVDLGTLADELAGEAAGGAAIEGAADAVPPDGTAAAAMCRLSVLGNLPYYATSEILLHMIAHRRHLGDAVITMQKEVADRLTARPGTRAYGTLSVAVALRATIESCLRLPATAFSPAPEVGSTVVRLQWQATDQLQGTVDEATVEQVVRAAFAQRRKRLVNSLAATLGLEREKLGSMVSSLGVEDGARAEDLTPEDFVRLAAALAPELGALETPAADGTAAGTRAASARAIDGSDQLDRSTARNESG